MAATKPKVVFWNLSVSHYIVGRFNAVVRRANLQFEVWFTHAWLADRSWAVNPAEWEFPARVIPQRPLFGRPLQVPVAELRETQPALLVAGYSTASWALGMFAARAMGTRTAFRVLPTYSTWFPRSRGKEMAKHFLFRAADGVKVSGVDGAAFARRYGMSNDRIVKVTQSIDVEHYARACSLNPAARAQARTRLGLRRCVFVYVGRLWSGKGLDFLFEAYREVRRQVADVSLLIVGDGVDEGRYRAMAREMPDVVFAGFVQPRDMPEYYASADVMVFPTLGDPHGLVVEEAMAAGLPVICTESAGDIRNRLPDGKAGYVVAPANPSVMAERMLVLARDCAMRAKFAREAGQIVRDRNHERYAADFERFVESILSKPRRRTPQAVLARGIGALVLAAAGQGKATPPVRKTEATAGVTSA
jgi:glycosyltransferase involved in cell wall biosynthesis